MPLRLDWTCLGLSAAKHPSVRPHLEGETPKNESSGAKRPHAWVESSRGQIVQGVNARRPDRGRNVYKHKCKSWRTSTSPSTQTASPSPSTWLSSPSTSPSTRFLCLSTVQIQVQVQALTSLSSSMEKVEKRQMGWDKHKERFQAISNNR